MKNILILALIALIPIAGAAGYIAHGGGSKAHEEHWIYGPRLGPMETNEKGIVVLCQAKTNSPAFANHIRAAAGDVVIQTCRAVKAQPTKRFGPEPKS
jgi:hypothetical protein